LEIADLMRHLMLERGMWEEYFDQAGVDLASQLVEIELGELLLSHGGVLIDGRGASSLTGLYAGGECAGASGLARATVDGHTAGLFAAEYALEQPSDGGVPGVDVQVEAARSRIEQFASDEPGSEAGALEAAVRATMNRYVRLDKDGDGLRTAIAELEALEPMARQLRARTPHGVLRNLEAQNLREFSLLVAEASLHRKGVTPELGAAAALFWRTDYPEVDPAEAELLVTIQRVGSARLAQLEAAPA
jgi:succinate dehydrogenase/fumarate reductase flavoprotein subunit